MKKTIVLSIAVILFSGLLFASQTAAETIELKFAHFMSPMHIQHRKSFDPFCKKVEEITNGQVKIKIYPGQALGGPKQLPDAVETGITDIAFIIPTYTTGRFPRISAFDLPFITDSATHATNIIYEVYDKYIAEDFKNYKVLWLFSTGPGQLEFVDNKVTTVDGIKGMKIRTPSAYMTKALKILEANPIGMPISKLTISLQKGVINGALSPFSAITDFKLHNMIKHITQVDLFVMPMAVVMNKGKYNSLSTSARKAIDQASGRQMGIHSANVYDEHDANTITTIKKQGKITIHTLSASEQEKLKNKLKKMQDDWVAEMSKKGLPAREILDAVLKAAGK